MFDPLILILGLGTGLVTGLLAGLFGIGGGVVLVPVFTAYFMWQGINPDLVMHLALATSLSCIVVTSALSAWTHHRHDAVDWSLVKLMAPLLMLGSAMAALTGMRLSSLVLAWVFFVLMFLISGLMLFDVKKHTTASTNINKYAQAFGSTVIGFVSGLMAIGGGVLNVPFLALQGVDLPRAIGSAAALGWPLAVAATAVYVFGGWNHAGLPEHQWGYVHWPATAVICLGASLSTGLGAKLTHRLPIHWLRPMFVLLLLVMAGRMAWSVQVA